MPSLDFETEKATFTDYYDNHWDVLEGATGSFVTLIRSLLVAGGHAPAKIERRIKDREECIKKFTRKYRSGLEASTTPYTIKDHITDLIGLRIICLYEDEVQPISDLICEHFAVLGVTDKIALVEGTEDSFGYKGLHLDLKLNDGRSHLPEYALYAAQPFELQIRTVVQDSWSVLDHNIKYKKSIPNSLKRRINTLAALFELADREFRQVRDATIAEIAKAAEEEGEVAPVPAQPGAGEEVEAGQYAPLNAFRFLRITKHFFPDFEFEAHKVDGFTADILKEKSDISRGKFNFYLRENISRVKRYQVDFLKANPGEGFNAYTVIRHCLYVGDPGVFTGMLTNTARTAFQAWLDSHAGQAA